ncbi:biotin--[acetyl-CoA-carboxylase] ligase [Parafrigoribacterium mesophilum]|uniref:biotin--[acetyl-CoA-carboxylase] ligase n=1 Tax=Parafrigoribacterium mesophilum TaxID=433646 RepID=UPI0031FC400A
MDLPLSTPLVPRLVALEQCDSTNSELGARATGGQEPEFSTVVTANQTRGHGRLGRIWVAPPGQTLAVSVLVTPVQSSGEALGLEHYGWLPLLAGLAMTRAVVGLLATTPPERVEGRPTVTLKWPNDVLIDGRKVAGLLAELLPDGHGVVLGAGLNLAIPATELPTPAATSLTLHGVAPEGILDAALSAYLRELRDLYAQFLRDGSAGIRTQVSAACGTLGKQVKVELPGGEILTGTAVDIDESGRLRIKTATDAPLTAVAAGDVTHVR